MESIKIKTISCLAAVCVSCLCMASQTYASEPPERYETYQGLVMAGYQGWFNTPKDGANLGWRHYGGKTGFCPDHALLTCGRKQVNILFCIQQSSVMKMEMWQKHFHRMTHQQLTLISDGWKNTG